jgi:hypothetical protein
MAAKTVGGSKWREKKGGKERGRGKKGGKRKEKKENKRRRKKGFAKCLMFGTRQTFLVCRKNYGGGK